RPASLEAWGRRQVLVAWSAAWPVEEGWWLRSRRLARMQLLLEGGVAVLLPTARGVGALKESTTDGCLRRTPLSFKF
ncbi:MAG: hypothetical protein WCJ28_01175, partial [Actinomycetota bacterium]